MAAALGTRWEVIARLTLSCVWLWLACGERPRNEDGAPRLQRREAQALQAPGTWSPTGAMAKAHESHTATRLLSGKVLVIGSEHQNGRLTSAEVYDPVTGTWSPTGSLSSARYGHTATLLPSGKVLVTGGSPSTNPSVSGCFASAEVYDPATGTWSPTGSLSSARYGHTAARLPSGKVLVTGGWCMGSSHPGIAELYDPATGTWSPTGLPASDLPRQTATLLSSGKLLVTRGNGNEPASAEVYDPATGTWSPTGAMSSARDGYTATRLPSGKVLVTGGYSPHLEPLTRAEVYDPATGTWSPTGSLSSGRHGHTATLLPSGRVLVTGGDGYPNGDLVSAEVYDPATGTWSSTGSLSSGRDGHTATLLLDGRVLVAGGGLLASAEVYGPALGVWRPTNVLASNTSGHTATLLPSGKVFLTEGHGSSGPPLRAQVYDPATGTSKPTGTLASSRSGHMATRLSSGKVMISGDADGFLGSVEVYDPATSTSRLANQIFWPLRYHTATLLLSGEVLITGGRPQGRGTWIVDASLYDPTTDTARLTGAMTTPRSRHTATLLPSGKVLVTGGKDAVFWNLASAEVYDPASGIWKSTGSMTMPRSDHTATLLPSGKVLVIGGDDSRYQPLASAEVYDPATGTWSFTGDLATARAGYTVTLLPSGKVLVAGGWNTAAFASAEVYDPAVGVWSPTATMAMARSSHTATLLPDGKVLVEGGSSIRANAEVYQEAPVVLTPAGSSVSNTNRPTYTGTAEAGSTVRVFVDGSAVGTTPATASGRWALVQPVALGDGSHMAMATAAAAGSTPLAESLANTFAVDATPPAAPEVLTPARDAFLNNNQPTYGGSAEPGSTVTVKVDGTAVGSTPAQASGAWVFSQPVALGAGAHTLGATATDAVGNTSPESHSHGFTVDTTPPATPVLLTPADGTTLRDNRPDYHGTAEARSTVTVWLGESAAGSARTNDAGEWHFTPATALSEGLHRATALATDPAGNASEPSPAHFFKVDTVPPEAPVVLSPEALVHTRRPLIGGTAEAQSTVTVWLDGTVVGTALADEAGAWHLTPATALEDGQHRVVAFATDAADNRSDPSPEVSFSMSQRGYYVSSCSASPSSPGGTWPWALLLLLALRRASRGPTALI